MHRKKVPFCSLPTSSTCYLCSDPEWAKAGASISSGNSLVYLPTREESDPRERQTDAAWSVLLSVWAVRSFIVLVGSTTRPEEIHIWGGGNSLRNYLSGERYTPPISNSKGTIWEGTVGSWCESALGKKVTRHHLNQQALKGGTHLWSQLLEDIEDEQGIRLVPGSL
jgi:hypothetical protein